jgi:hypothetical protein
MVFEHQHECPSKRKAIEAIAGKLYLNRETSRVWVRGAEVDDDRRPGLTTDERARDQGTRAGHPMIRAVAEPTGASVHWPASRPPISTLRASPTRATASLLLRRCSVGGALGRRATLSSGVIGVRETDGLFRSTL